MNAFEAAEKNGKAVDLQRELETLFNEYTHKGKHNVNSCHYLRVTARRRIKLIQNRVP